MPDNIARRHRGRRPRVPGGYPHVLEVRLTTNDYMLLAVAAARAELADGAYASEVVHRHLAAEFNVVPADWREVMAQLLEHRATLAGLRGDVAAVGRLANQIAREVNSNRSRPAGDVLTRLAGRVETVLAAADEGLAELDQLTTNARTRL
ncbi:hypothetical protein [Amycolatopsis keratiniphila]|uniref:hypothetical protein n=1 Tax=Amycolatopsis keratiniphila TaxID=129921 RepID=UPI000F4DBCB2|nr:hypothetical protein [Amycolatopsis keratiniphila]